MNTYKEMYAQADALDEQAREIRKAASKARQAELKAKPIADRIVYAAYSRCPCGAGLAYDPCHEYEDSPLIESLSGAWDCSAILLGTANKNVRHTDKLPFVFYEVKSEGQPSVAGATTRPTKESSSGSQ